ncbi:MAG TPA: gliding motility-associated C-terminal domain-containing protein [Bacteroidia bacterium]
MKIILQKILFFFLLSFGEIHAQCVSTYPYLEDFETAPAWTTGGANNDWAWGTPTHAIISTAGHGAKCWCVGGLSGSFYNYSELSWIESPCFDFTSLNYPWISFKIFWEDEWIYDGLVLQYSINGGSTWSNVGAFGDPVDCLNSNWYNYNNITWLTSIPVKNGWTGRIGPTVGSCKGGNGSGGWVTATHCLSGLANQPNVIFRFLFGAGTTCNSYDGIAIDYIQIQEATPNVANFSFSCPNGNTFAFTNLSTPCPTNFTWNFGDLASGAANTSILQNPTHTFSSVGTYTVTLVSHGPCNAPDSIKIPVSIMSINATGHASCTGNSNGSATVNVSGGAGTYSYLWTNGQTNSTATGLNSGNYSVTITDASGCTKTGTVSIVSASQPTVTATSTQAGCTVANGTATANASGGTGPYTYSWSPSGGSASTANNLNVGTYTVIATDANGCTNTNTVNITTTGAPTVTVTTTPTGCTVANGTATANASGGSGTYTYLWSPSGGNASTANNLSTGIYSVVVTDANGCSAVTTVSVSQTGNVPSTTAATTNTVSCFGGSNGSATATPSGGTPGYTYIWNTTPVQNTQTASNLSSGTYSVVVTDVNGCTATSIVAITQAASITLTANLTNSISCNGNSNGSSSAIASGGTPSYTYSWNTSPIQNTQIATGLSAGNYNVTVTDANGCTKFTSVTITQPQALSISTTPTNVTCNGGSNGSVTAGVTNGTSPYTYIWNTAPAQHTQTATGLSSGTYSITITDANGCTKQSIVLISQPPPITLSVSGNDTICKGYKATLTATVNGGTPVYTYTWNPVSQNGSSIVVTPTTSSNYSVEVTDANGCTSLIQTLNVLVLSTPVALFDTASSGTFGSTYLFSDLSTPSATITVWNWNFGDGNSSTQQNPVHSFPGAGTYTVTEVVFNKFGCPDTFKRVITINEGILIPNVFTPDGDGINDVWYVPNSGMKEFNVEIFDRWGTKVFESTSDEIRWDGRSSSGKLLSDGTYFFVLNAYLKVGYGEKNYSTIGYITLLTKK